MFHQMRFSLNNILLNHLLSLKIHWTSLIIVSKRYTECHLLLSLKIHWMSLIIVTKRCNECHWYGVKNSMGSQFSALSNFGILTGGRSIGEVLGLLLDWPRTVIGWATYGVGGGGINCWSCVGVCWSCCGGFCCCGWSWLCS